MWISKIKKYPRPRSYYLEKVKQNVLSELEKKNKNLFYANSFSYSGCIYFSNNVAIYYKDEKWKNGKLLGHFGIGLWEYYHNFFFQFKIKLAFNCSIEDWLSKHNNNYYCQLPFSDVDDRRYHFTYKEIIFKEQGKIFIKDFKIKSPQFLGKMKYFPWYSEAIIDKTYKRIIALKHKNTYIIQYNWSHIVILDEKWKINFNWLKVKKIFYKMRADGIDDFEIEKWIKDIQFKYNKENIDLYQIKHNNNYVFKLIQNKKNLKDFSGFKIFINNVPTKPFVNMPVCLQSNLHGKFLWGYNWDFQNEFNKGVLYNVFWKNIIDTI